MLALSLPKGPPCLPPRFTNLPQTKAPHGETRRLHLPHGIRCQTGNMDRQNAASVILPCLGRESEAGGNRKVIGVRWPALDSGPSALSRADSSTSASTELANLGLGNPWFRKSLV